MGAIIRGSGGIKLQWRCISSHCLCAWYASVLAPARTPTQLKIVLVLDATVAHYCIFILNNCRFFSLNKTLHLRWCKSMKIRRWSCQLSIMSFSSGTGCVMGFFHLLLSRGRSCSGTTHQVQADCTDCVVSKSSAYLGCVLHSLLKQTENWEQWLWLIKRACHQQAPFSGSDLCA